MYFLFKLDAKKSPLALLAQTCSQIGADTSAPSKPSLPSSVRTSKDEKHREKSSPTSSTGSASPKTCFRPYEDDKVKSKESKKDSPRESPKSADQKEKSSPAAIVHGAAAFHPYLAPYLLGRPDACRDPYCTGCTTKCPAGCVQCEKGPAQAYAHLAALAASQPYLCSWIAADGAFCGKRFASGEELLVHLRAHTADPLVHPLLRSYPSAASGLRYSPYPKPLALPPYFPPSLAPYYPPYSLYPSRLSTSHP